MIGKGEAWEEPVASGTAPDVTVSGDDRALVRALEPWRDGCPLVQWTPAHSAFAASVGLDAAAGAPRGHAVACDLLVMAGAEQPALNAIVLGAFPPGRFTREAELEVAVDGRTVFSGRATTVVVGNGQFVAGADLFARGHPGDGRAEVLVVAVPPGDRARFKARLASGDATAHPGVHRASGSVITVASSRALDASVDGARTAGVRATEIHVHPRAFRLLL